MKFEEVGDIYTVERYEPMVFVYILIDAEGEVIYVGKTEVGMYRPYFHYRKPYKTIKIIPCEKKDLVDLEKALVRKYKPVYNRRVSRVENLQLSNVAVKLGINLPEIRTVMEGLKVGCFKLGDGNWYVKRNDIVNAGYGEFANTEPEGGVRKAYKGAIK